MRIEGIPHPDDEQRLRSRRMRQIRIGATAIAAGIGLWFAGNEAADKISERLSQSSKPKVEHVEPGVRPQPSPESEQPVYQDDLQIERTRKPKVKVLDVDVDSKAGVHKQPRVQHEAESADGSTYYYYEQSERADELREDQLYGGEDTGVTLVPKDPDPK